MTQEAPPQVEPVGANPHRLWGLTAEQRLGRIAAAQGLAIGRGGLLANLDFAFDPAWLRWIAGRPDHAVTRGGALVLAHCADPAGAEAARRAMLEGGAAPEGMVLVEQETFDALHDPFLRRRDRPWIERLTGDSAAAVERTSYYASYKGVTDLLTKYLWPEWALWLTRLSARIGLSPNFVSLVGALFCVLAGLAFWRGLYWPGMAAALAFMVLDTVDGKLARCTITSSKLGDALDHGIDHVHPPIWWWLWGLGLARYGTPLPPNLFLAAMIGAVGGYFVLRAIEGAFLFRFGIQIHVWKQLDSRFRLVSARRNPNMVILFAALLAGRPDWGLVGIAAWTLISCLFHLVRLAQAWMDRARGRPVESWLQ